MINAPKHAMLHLLTPALVAAMVFQESLELSDLITGLATQKPRLGLGDQETTRVRTLKFENKDDAEEARRALAELLPDEKKGNVRLIEMKGLTDDVDYRVTIPSTLLHLLKKTIKPSAPPLEKNGKFVDLFDAHSRSSDGGLRSMPDDVLHPEESVNTFMVPLSGLIHAFDLCERLDRAGTKATGNRHKYYASSGSYGLRFENQLDAENARDIFTGLSGSETGMTIDTEVINHEPFFWLKIPSDIAFKILKEKEDLSAKYSHLKQSFIAGIEAGDTSQAERERASFLELVEVIGLGSSHVAELMTREALAKTMVER